MNKLCEKLGIKYPIIQAGMAGGATTPELVSAVSNAGGLGILAASRLTPTQLKEAILKIKSKLKILLELIFFLLLQKMVIRT